MTSDPRGRWFRVYPRMVRQHPKFHDLTGIELGAWTALRSECELRDGAVLADVAEARLILRRRQVPRRVFDRLVELRLFDVLEDGTVAVHDRADHDRPRYPSDEAEAAAERKRRSRAGHEPVTTRDISGHDTRARVQPAEPAPANSTQPAAGAGLPAEDDSATFACRRLADGGKWLGDREYTATWDDMDRRYTAAWVQEEIPAACEAIIAKTGKVRAWDLKRMVEMRCAERARLEEKRRQEGIVAAQAAEAERLRREAQEATPEQRELRDLTKTALAIWRRQGASGKVPTDREGLRRYIAEQQNGAAA